MTQSLAPSKDLIVLDPSRDALFDELGLKRLRESYMRDDEGSPQERYAYVAAAFASDQAHAQRLYDYASKHWLSFATPILSFGRYKRGLPISCFGSYVDDTIEGLIDTQSEVNWLSVMGGGVAIGMGIRSSDDKSTGLMTHIKTYDANSLAYRQGKTRRGSYAMYVDIDHPDLLIFLEMRKASGDQNLRAHNLHHGLNVTDAFMEKVKACLEDPDADDSWPLVDPKTKEVKEVASVKDLWQRIISMRAQTGEPYLHFIDTANKALPDFQKAKGLEIKHSNLCVEIELPTNKDRTFVCCLSSMNAYYYDEWKDNPLIIRDVMEMLDNVLQYFIDNAPDTVQRARFSAQQERAVGLGVLGFHSYLQKKGIPFESALAVSFNRRLFGHLKEQTEAANLALGAERGSPPDCEGTGRRFSHTMALAPTASSSIICGNVSPSIEPYRANAFKQNTLSGSHLLKNKALDDLIRSKDVDYDETWSEIIGSDGSIQDLECFTDYEKDVFKTAMEIDQQWVVQHASTRAPFVDQGQSVNLFFPPEAEIEYVHDVHYQAWAGGLKSLYYYRSDSVGKADKVSKRIKRERLDAEPDECLACAA